MSTARDPTLFLRKFDGFKSSPESADDARIGTAVEGGKRARPNGICTAVGLASFGGGKHFWNAGEFYRNCIPGSRFQSEHY
jgi:hypothetical protein